MAIAYYSRDKEQVRKKNTDDKQNQINALKIYKKKYGKNTVLPAYVVSARTEVQMTS